MTVLAKMGRKALPGHVRLASFDRHEWRYMPPHGTTKDMLLDPSFWSHVSKGFTVGDKIEVVWEDGTAYMVLLVRDCSRLYAKLGVIHEVHFEDRVEPGVSMDLDGYEVKWGGPHRKYRVIRKKDNQVMKDMLPSAEDGRKYILDHVKALAA